MTLYFHGISKVKLCLGGWWSVQNFSQISGALAIEFGERCYIKALDNGLFVLGPPHDEGRYLPYHFT